MEYKNDQRIVMPYRPDPSDCSNDCSVKNIIFVDEVHINHIKSIDKVA